MPALEHKTTTHRLIQAAAFSFIQGVAAALGGCAVTAVVWWIGHR